jgi:hypothetical protein
VATHFGAHASDGNGAAGIAGSKAPDWMGGKSRDDLENHEHRYRLNWLLHDLWNMKSLFPP